MTNSGVADAQSLDSPAFQREHEATPLGPRRSIPAWVLSFAVHFCGLITLAILLRPNPPPAADLPQREVGIVLAHSEVGQSEKYFDSSTADSEKDSADSAAKDSQLTDDPLPPTDAQQLLVPPGEDLPPLESGLVASGAHGADVLNELFDSQPGRKSILPGLGDAEMIAADRAANQKAGPTGPVAELEVFGSVTAVGRSFVFLIDRSKSMGGEGLGAIEAAERELKRAISRLGPSHRFQIVAYNQKPSQSSKDLIAATPDNKMVAAKFLAGIVAFGGTQHEMPILSALNRRPDAVFLLTDGGDPPLSQAEMRRITVRNSGRTTINCLHFGHGPLQATDNFLRQLARLNGGAYAYIDMSNQP